MQPSVLIQHGSSKDIYGVSANPKYEHEELLFLFKDDVSVFDLGPVPGGVPGLGKLRRDFSVKIFGIFNAESIPNHFISAVGENGILVKACSVPEKNLKAKSGARLLPLELIFRNFVTPKIVDRVESLELDRSRFSLAAFHPFRAESSFSPAFVECSTKHEASDRYIDDAEAAELARITAEDLQRVYSATRSAALCIREYLKDSPVTLEDGKFEFGINTKCQIFMCDSISPDELGISDLSGKRYDKNPLRDWYRKMFPVWYKDLLEAKRAHPLDKSFWPKYPDAPAHSLIGEMTRSYAQVVSGFQN